VVAEQNHAGLHALLNPSKTAERTGKGRASLKEQAMAVRAAIKQRMTALALERHSLAVVIGQKRGKVRFNLINGLIAQRLLFARLSELNGPRRTLEVAAGDGSLSRFLQARGVQISATDDYSWPDRILYPESVARMDAVTSLRQHAPEVVICSWPPARNTFEREIFRTRSVQMYLVIASQHRFASGNWADYEAQSHFTLERSEALSGLVLPPELGSQVLIFRRGSSDPRQSTGAEKHDPQ
jgi:hypothetical protein